MDKEEWKLLLTKRQDELMLLIDKLNRESGKTEDPLSVTYNKDFADIACNLTDREQVTAEIIQVAHELSLIKHALHKIVHFPEKCGLCEKCLRPISDKRLQAIPWARYCKSCKDSYEKNAR